MFNYYITLRISLRMAKLAALGRFWSGHETFLSTSVSCTPSVFMWVWIKALPRKGKMCYGLPTDHCNIYYYYYICTRKSVSLWFLKTLAS